MVTTTTKALLHFNHPTFSSIPGIMLVYIGHQYRQYQPNINQYYWVSIIVDTSKPKTILPIYV